MLTSVRRWLVLAAAAAPVAGCGSSGTGASAENRDATAGASDGASTGPGADSGLDDGATSGPSDAGAEDAPRQVPPTVDAGACPNLPALLDGGWINVSPPGSNYASTYSGIDAIAIRPDNPAIVYAGADSNGMFRSTDCGATWTRINTGENAAAMSTGRPWSLLIDPITPDVMYTVQGYGTSGLWKSTNAGVDWTDVLTPAISAAFYAGGQITGIAMDPDRSHPPRHRVAPGLRLHLRRRSRRRRGRDLPGREHRQRHDLDPARDPATLGRKQLVAMLGRKTWLWGGFFGGLWRTTDEGVTWTEVPVNDAGSSPGLPNAYAETNYYEPYSWQDSTGRYYLPTKSWFLPGG